MRVGQTATAKVVSRTILFRLCSNCMEIPRRKLCDGCGVCHGSLVM